MAIHAPITGAPTCATIIPFPGKRAQRQLRARRANTAPTAEMLFAGGLGRGIESSATLIEIRLALHEYRLRYGDDHWRLYARDGEGR